MHKFFIAFWVKTSWRYLALSLIQNNRIARCFSKAAFYTCSIWNRKDKQTKRRSMETKVESICQSTGFVKLNCPLARTVCVTRSEQSSKYYRLLFPAGMWSPSFDSNTLHIYNVNRWWPLRHLKDDHGVIPILRFLLINNPQSPRKVGHATGSMSPSVFSYGGLGFYVPPRTR